MISLKSARRIRKQWLLLVPLCVPSCAPLMPRDHGRQAAPSSDWSSVVFDMHSAMRFAADPSTRVFDARTPSVDTLTNLESGCAEAKVLRIEYPQSPHSGRFLVGVAHDKFFRLGGFTSPDVSAFVESMRTASGREDQLALARCLARVLDPNGALFMLPIGNPQDPFAPRDSASVQVYSEMQRRGYSTVDTIVERAGGSRWVRVSLLSASDRVGGLEWSWRSYVFVFTATGQLSLWYVRADDPFRVP
jgi:hypothetical protein